jgi:uncharacterized membrane protein YhaH (DUF805 family)
VEKLLPHLSFKGRANRQRYWVTAMVLGISLAVATILALSFGVAGAVVGAALIGVLIWANLANAARRLHDRDKSAWWLLIMFAPIFVLAFLGGAAEAAAPDGGLLFTILRLPFAIWVFVELGCLRGTEGENRFGPDPLQPENVAEVFG